MLVDPSRSMRESKAGTRRPARRTAPTIRFVRTDIRRHLHSNHHVRQNEGIMGSLCAHCNYLVAMFSSGLDEGSKCAVQLGTRNEAHDWVLRDFSHVDWHNEFVVKRAGRGTVIRGGRDARTLSVPSSQCRVLRERQPTLFPRVNIHHATASIIITINMSLVLISCVLLLSATLGPIAGKIALNFKINDYQINTNYIHLYGKFVNNSFL